ncbi:MAG: thiamine diphosphokinase [Chloroflexota bacterium]|nr:thiamine diphosphokinase [Chloroflexota bacterium]
MDLKIRRALIFANGDPNDGAMVRRALDDAPDALAIAADGGARLARHYERLPHVVIGDMDSVAVDDLAWAQRVGAQIMRYPAAKDETDLELALLCAAERAADWIRVIGGVGDRLDQTLSNVYLLALPELIGRDVRLVAGKQEAWLVGVGTTTIDGAPGDTVSLLPLAGDASGIDTDGLVYPLRAGTLRFGPARGVSNVLAGARATVTVGAGALLVIHTVGRA